MKRFNRYTALILILVMLTTLTNVVSADIAQDQKNQLQEIESENKILEQQKNEAQAEVEKLDRQAAEVSASLAKTNQKLSDTEKKITKTTSELKAAEESVKEQYDSMKVRIQYMYENGNTQMIDLLFNSDSITDFMDKAEYITQLSEYDRNMLDTLVETKQEVAEKKAALEDQKSELETLKGEQQKDIDKLVALSEEKQKEVDSVKGLIAENEKHAEDLEAEIARMEREAAEAEARRKAEAETNNTKPQPTPHGTGNYTWPVPGHSLISSDYGDTEDRSSGHNGIDIAAPAGTPIVAADSGVVEWANYSSSAGNWIGINHGNGVYTVYMHMSALGVSAGMQINAGQTIGYVGTTGFSTGNHLHFGVRVNGYWVNPWNYLS